MKKVIGLLTLALMASTANAVEVSFEGKFRFAPETVLATNSFSGKFDFDLLNPDSQSVKNEGLVNEERHLRYPSAWGYVNFDTQRYSFNDIELDFNSNDSEITEEQIAKNGFSGLINAGIYDSLFLRGASFGAIFDSETSDLFNGEEFSIIALFEENTFETVGFDFQQAMAAESKLVFLGFGALQMKGGVETFHGVGELDPAAMEISAVPVPAAIWLFGSAIAGLAVRSRKRV